MVKIGQFRPGCRLDKRKRFCKSTGVLKNQKCVIIYSGDNGVEKGYDK